jgi:hypothetical protein
LITSASTAANWPELEKVMKASPDVRFIFKEWPIFASRWENSEKAAQRGLDVWKQKGAAGYMAYQGSSQKTESMVTPVFATPILTISWLA